MLRLEFAHHTDPGKLRAHNEDALGWCAPAVQGGDWLFVLADGVGGQDAGELASRWTVETLTGDFTRGELALAPRLRQLLQAANQRLHDAGLSGEFGKGMASTVVACALSRDRAIIAHAGDSRCYLRRRGELRQLTQDHTFAAEQQALGLLSGDEPGWLPARGCLSRSLGNDLFVQPELRELRLEPGDLLLLSSDGLHGALEGPRPGAAASTRLARQLASPLPLPELAQHLVELARDVDGGDNISVLLIRILEVERLGMYRGRPYRLPGS